MSIVPKNTPPYYEFGEGGTGAKKYVAFMTQFGTGAPTADILVNTIGDIVWTRDSTGYYLGTLAGAFTLDKTVLDVKSVRLDNDGRAMFGRPNSEDVVAIITLTTGDVDSDDKLLSTPIEITVYS